MKNIVKKIGIAFGFTAGMVVIYAIGRAIGYAIGYFGKKLLCKIFNKDN